MMLGRRQGDLEEWRPNQGQLPKQEVESVNYGLPSDLSEVDSIYVQQELPSVRIRLNPAYVTTEGLVRLTTPETAYWLLRAIYSTTLEYEQEHFIMLALNPNCEVRGYKVLSLGVKYNLSLDLKIVYRAAIQMGATYLLVAHNRPFNCLTPSVEDLQATKKIARGGALLNIELHDHIIYDLTGFVSLRTTHPELFEQDVK